MQLIWIIVKKDVLILLRDKSLCIVCFLFWLSWIACLLLSFQEYKTQYNTTKKASEIARHGWLEQGSKNPHAAGHTGTVLFKPISPLSVFDPGLTNYLGDYVVLETHVQHETEGRRINRENSVSRMVLFSPGFFLQKLFPLLLIFLTYNSLSGEKEDGTLRMLLSQHVSIPTVFWGKWVAGGFKTLLLLAPIYLTFLFILYLLPGAFLRHCLDFHVVLLVYLCYYLALLFLAVSVSALCTTSNQSLVVLFGFWIFTNIVLPRLSGSLSDSLYPAPSNFALKTKFDEGHGDKYVYGYKAMESFQQRYEQVQAELMRKYAVSSPDSLQVNTFGFVIEETEEEGQRIYDTTYGLVKQAFAKQESFRRVANFSPIAVLQTISWRISGTSSEEHQSFIQQAEHYRRNMMKKLNMDIAYHSHDPGFDSVTKTRKKGQPYTRGKDLWEKIPPFLYEPIPLSFHLAHLRLELLQLLGWCSLSFVFFNISATRWQP